MKSLTMNLMLAAAAMMVSSTVASAQSIKAEIPFSFRAGGVLMPAGTYEVMPSTGQSWLYLRSREVKKAALLGSFVREDVPQAWLNAHRPTLEFACTEDRCTLSRIWTATSGAALRFFNKANRDDNGKQVAIIEVVGTRAD